MSVLSLPAVLQSSRRVSSAIDESSSSMFLWWPRAKLSSLSTSSCMTRANDLLKLESALTTSPGTYEEHCSFISLVPNTVARLNVQSA